MTFQAPTGVSGYVPPPGALLEQGIGGGGRYDGLSEDIGGPPLPGTGFAVGPDRIVLAIESERTGARGDTG